MEAILAEKPEEQQANGEVFDREAYLRDVEHFEDVEVVVSGRNAVSRIDRKKERAEKLFLHYIQRWAKDYLRRRLDWVVDDMVRLNKSLLLFKSGLLLGLLLG